MVTRSRWASKAELTRGGAEVESMTYHRASQDTKEQGKSVGDQEKLNRRQAYAFHYRNACDSAVSLPATAAYLTCREANSPALAGAKFFVCSPCTARPSRHRNAWSERNARRGVVHLDAAHE